jgi:hypothetical protein
VAGYVSDLGDDEQTFCSECLRSLWQGRTCKRRDCPGYAPIYLRDQTERVRANLAAWDGKTCLVTLTAPGVDEPPWNRSRCRPGEHRCSGQRGCRVAWVPAAGWNSTVTKRLGELLKVAREHTRRIHGSKVKVVLLAYVCEAQQRGVFHPHLVLGYGTAAERAALDTFRNALKRRRGNYGFGTGRQGSFDAGKPERFTARDAGRYISKYLRPDGAKTSFVPLLEAINRITPRDPETGRLKVLVRPVYVSTALTRRTGVTMTFLRFKRWVWVEWGSGATDDDLIRLYMRHRDLCARERLARAASGRALRLASWTTVFAPGEARGGPRVGGVCPPSLTHSPGSGSEITVSTRHLPPRPPPSLIARSHA